MATAGLSWVNHLETAIIATNSEVAGLPLANLTDLHGATIWRTQTHTGVTITLDFGSAKPVKAAMIAAANFSASATWRLRLSTTSAHAGDLSDSGVVAMNRGLIDNKRSQAAMVLAGAISTRYAKLDLDDPGRAAQGYFDVGLLWIGDLWQPARNFSWGAQGGLRDESPVSSSIGGQDYVDVRDKFRAETFSFNFLTDAEYFASIDQIDAIAGIARNVLVIPDPGGAYMNSQAIVGRVTELSPTSRAYFNGRSRAFSIKERL